MTVHVARACSCKLLLLLCALVLVVCTILQASWTAFDNDNAHATGFGAGTGANELALRRRTKELPIADMTRELLLNQLSSPHMSEYIHNVRDKLNHTLQLGLQPFDLQAGINVWDMHIPNAVCADIQRVGSIGDGGKWVCGLSHLQQLKIMGIRKCVIYSYGVSFDSTFEAELHNRAGCEVHAFDPTVGGIAGRSNGIAFHKHGLASSSGKTKDFMMVESLQDAMHRLGHAYVDILKVDVEGAEWEVFAKLLSDMPRFPLFGQLLIELHHKDMHSTHNFFRMLESKGFMSISRELNLQPCIAGGLPFASEYSFIHPASFFATSRSIHPVPALTPSWHRKLKGVVYFLSHHRRVPMLQQALSSLYTNFLQAYPYPVVVFSDDLTPKDRKALQSVIPVRIDFRELEFKFPDGIDVGTVPERTQCSYHSSTVGYRHMIQFHAIDAQAMLGRDFDYVWRLDDDSRVGAPIAYDPFRLMHVNNKRYGFVNSVQDDPLCVQGLWNFTREFMARHHTNGTFFHQWPEGLVFYNNFEISHKSVWATQLYKQFIREVHNVGGIYHKRWGDAPLHTLAVSMQLRVDQVHRFSDIAYTHLPFANQTTGGLPKPDSDPLSNQECYYMYFNWVCGGANGTANSTNTTFATSWGTSVSLAKPVSMRPKGVIYTFARSGRIHLLSDMLLSVRANFNDIWEYPVVVFHQDLTDAEIKAATQAYGTGIVVRKVDILSASEQAVIERLNVPARHECGNTSIFQRALHKFLTIDVIEHLPEYDWFWRIGDSGRLAEPVSYDIFHKMELEGYRYGYMNMMNDDAKCIRGLWSFTDELITSAHLDGVQTFRDWSVGVVMLGDFEVSHRSVWESQNVRTFFRAVTEHGGVYTARWGDAALRTIGALLSISYNEINRFSDIAYDMNMGTMSDAPLRPAHSSSIRRYSQQLMPEISNIFRPRRFGWVGGDVAASFALPRDLSASATGNTESDRYVWLFGDTLVGTSDGKRRLELAMIGNSVGMSEVTNGKIEHMDYYWRSTSEGEPCGVFECEPTKKTSLWPIAGLSVQSDHGWKAMVFAQRSKVLSASSTTEFVTESLRFRLEEMVALRIDNPTESPLSWRYTSIGFPKSSCFQWVALASASGRAYAISSEDEYIYLIGSYEYCHHEDNQSNDDLLISLPKSLQVIGRIRTQDLLTPQLDHIEVLTSLNGQKQWVLASSHPSQQQLVTIRPIGTSEASLHYDHEKQMWIAVSMHVLEGRISLCSAQQTVEAEWECGFVADIPAPYKNLKHYTVYGAKYHPQLRSTSPSGFVLSFIPNIAGDPSAIMTSEEYYTYTPKFLDVSLLDSTD